MNRSKTIEYTSRWNNFQFRNPVYLDGHIEPYIFDLVLWISCEPHQVRDLETGEEKISTEYCISVGNLVWDKKEKGFDFNSCGLRFLEHYINGLNEWIMAFAKMKEIELTLEEQNEIN